MVIVETHVKVSSLQVTDHNRTLTEEHGNRA